MSVPASSLAGLVLLGWKTRDEAVRLLQEHCVFDPSPTDRQAEALWADMRARVNALRGREIAAAERLPFTNDECAVVERCRADWRARGYPAFDVIKIDPRPLVVYQLEIVVARSEEIASRVVSPASWAEQFLCTQPTVVHPAIRHTPNAIDVDVPHAEWGLLFDPDRGFLLAEAARHVNVGRIGDRQVLWGGYHRAYAAAAFAPPAGRTILAAVTDDAARTAASAASMPRTSGLRAAQSDNPPMFADFFDPQLALPVLFKPKRFTLQIRARVVARELEPARLAR